MQPTDNSAAQPGQVIQPEAPVTAPVTPQTLTVDPAVVNAVVQAAKPEVEQAAAEAVKSMVNEFERTKLGKGVVKFFDSALGKSVQTLMWTVAAFLLTILGVWLGNFHFNAALLSLGIPGVLNWILYTAKVFADSKTPNLPTKTQ